MVVVPPSGNGVKSMITRSTVRIAEQTTTVRLSQAYCADPVSNTGVVRK